MHRTGAVLAVAVVFMGVLLAIMCPAFDHHRRQAGNQVMTMVMLQNLHAALAIYAKRCGGYPASLEELEGPLPGTAATCARSGSFADVVRSERRYREGDDLGMFAFRLDQLAALRRTGVHKEYGFRYFPQGPRSSGAYASYVLTADPLEREVTGFSSFWLSSNGDLRENRTRPAGPGDQLTRSFALPLNGEVGQPSPPQATDPGR